MKRLTHSQAVKFFSVEKPMNTRCEREKRGKSFSLYDEKFSKFSKRLTLNEHDERGELNADANRWCFGARSKRKARNVISEMSHAERFLSPRAHTKLRD
jgi:hypothetical protein